MADIVKKIATVKTVIGIAVLLVGSIVSFLVAARLGAKESADTKERVICLEKADKVHDSRMNGYDVLIGQQQVVNGTVSRDVAEIKADIKTILMRLK